MAAGRGDVMTRLTRAALGALPAPARPVLTGPAPQPGVVHFGVGAFHRAHQAVFTEHGMAVSGDRSWGIVAVAPRSAGVVEALGKQDGLFCVLERDNDRSRVRAVNALAAAVHAPGAPDQVLAHLADDRTRVVTLTITEKGYLIDPATGGLRDDDVVRADLAAVAARKTPSSAIGVLAAGMLRRAAGDGEPLTVVSCDNLIANGPAAARVLTEFAQRLPGAAGEALAAYLHTRVTFPASMVDRIVPATTATDRTTVRELTGLRDDATVVAEPFTQWVIEDAFAADRPPWAAAGAELVEDVTPYETAKLRLLNAAHSMTAYLGALAGHRTIAAALADPAIEGAVRALQREVLATIEAPAGWNLSDYAESVLTRFRNAALGHRCEQVAADGSHKLAVRIVPTLLAARAAGDPPLWTLTALAAWVRFVVHGRDEAGRELTVADPALDELRAVAGGGGDDVVRAVLHRAGLLPEEAFDAAVVSHLTRVYADLGRYGVAQTCRGLASF